MEAQNGAFWETFQGVPGGGSGYMVKTVSGDLYASNNTRYVYRSIDGGYNWALLPNPDIDTSAYDFANMTVGRAGTLFKFLNYPDGHSSLYRSADQGISWSLVEHNTLLTQVEETADGTFVGIGMNMIYRSTNQGASWEIVYQNDPADSIRQLKVLANGEFWVSLADSAYARSAGSGINWSVVKMPTNRQVFVSGSGSIFWADNSTIQRSSDNGLAFQPVVVNDPPPGYGWTTNFCYLNNGRLLFTHSAGKLYYSDDDGITWDNMNVPGITWLQQISPLSDGTIFAIPRYSNTIYRSADGGAHWEPSAYGTTLAIAPHFVSPDTMLGVRGHLFRSYDHGHNWEVLTNVLEGTVDELGVLSKDSLLVIRKKHLELSADGGEHFQVLVPAGDSLFNLHVAQKTKTIFVMKDHQMLRSGDRGQSWQLVRDSTYLFGITTHKSGRLYALFCNCLVSGQLNSLWSSEDDGLSWQALPLPGMIQPPQLITTEQGDIYVVDGAFLHVSIDNGQTWITRELPEKSGKNIVSDNAGNLFTSRDWGVAGEDKIYLSINKGITWQTLPYPWPTRSTGASFLSVSPDQKLYVGYGIDMVHAKRALLNGALLSGNVWSDADADCSTDDPSGPLNEWVVQAEGSSGTYYTNTDPAGKYLMLVDSGTYSVSLQPRHPLWWSVCDSDQVVQVTDQQLLDSVDFRGLAMADCPLMSVQIAIPVLRRCFNNMLYFSYCNQGSEAADSAWIDLSLDPRLDLVNSPLPYNDLGNNVFRIFLGQVMFGDCGQFNVVVHVDCDSTVLGQTHCITAHAFPDTLCSPVPDWSGASIEARVQCQDSLVQFQLQNTGAAPSQLLDYIIIEDDVVLMQGSESYNAGEQITLNVPANGHTWRVESVQEPGHPFSILALAFTEGCGGYNSLGYINQFSVNGWTPSIDRECVENTGSYDPNDKQGFPLGYGEAHNIRPGQELEYLIRFQNTGTDTAFTVLIRDTLSAWLDPASVQAGAASHPYTWTLSGNNVLTFTFENILLPDSNANLAGSNGFVRFRIRQQAEVPPGSLIFNSAAIYFDYNEPVITNETWHTVAEPTVGTQAAFFQQAAGGISASPNPAQDVVILRRIDGAAFRNDRLVVTDALGRPVGKAVLNGFQYRFVRQGLPAGLYFYRVESGNGKLVGSGKIVLE